MSELDLKVQNPLYRDFLQAELRRLTSPGFVRSYQTGASSLFGAGRLGRPLDTGIALTPPRYEPAPQTISGIRGRLWFVL